VVALAGKALGNIAANAGTGTKDEAYGFIHRIQYDAGVTLKILFKSIYIWIYKFSINLFPAQFPVSHTTNLEASKRGEKLETLGT